MSRSLCNFLSERETMKSSWSTALLLCVASLGSAGCGGAEHSRQGGAAERLAGKLVLSGSTTMGPLMEDIGRRFRELHPELQVEVRGGGSGRGIADARDSKADLGMASRYLLSEERDVRSFPIARDGVCLIVHKDNPVQGLDREQVLNIFTAKVTNWKQVGGRDAPITVVDRGAGQGEVELLTHYLKLRAEDIKSRSKAGGNPEAIRAVAGDPSAVTYLSVGAADEEIKRGGSVKLLAAEGVAATPANVASGVFPITRPLSLVTRGLPNGAAKRLIYYALSPQVRDLVQRHGFVPYLD
jgi:phosphate transport system substrate-binding protein